MWYQTLHTSLNSIVKCPLAIPENEIFAHGQMTWGIPVAENHSDGHSNGASSWLPNTVDQGIPLLLEEESALSQYKVALAIGRLFAVMTSPK